MSRKVGRYVSSNLICVNVSLWLCFPPGCIRVQNHLHVSFVTRHSEPRVIKRLTCYLIPKKMVEVQKKGFQGGKWWDRNPLFLCYQKLLCRNQLLSQTMVSFYKTGTSAPTVQNIWYNFYVIKWAMPRYVILWQHFVCSLFSNELCASVYFCLQSFELLCPLNYSALWIFVHFSSLSHFINNLMILRGITFFSIHNSILIHVCHSHWWTQCLHVVQQTIITPRKLVCVTNVLSFYIYKLYKWNGRLRLTVTGFVQAVARNSTVFLPGNTVSLDRPYTCNVCNAAFRKLSHLKQHIRMHTGERPYKCNLCDR